MINYEKFSSKRSPAIFVVHGVGKQELAETAVSLYNNLQDVLPELKKELPSKPDRKQTKSSDSATDLAKEQIRTALFDEKKSFPLIYDGYWENYEYLDKLIEKIGSERESGKPYSDYEKNF